MTTTSPRIEWTRKEEYQPAEPVLYTWLTWQDYLILREGSATGEGLWFFSSLSALIAFGISLITTWYTLDRSFENSGCVALYFVLALGTLVSSVFTFYFGWQWYRKRHPRVFREVTARLEAQFRSSGAPASDAGAQSAEGATPTAGPRGAGVDSGPRTKRHRTAL